jgi:hypothetical protein
MHTAEVPHSQAGVFGYTQQEKPKLRNEPIDDFSGISARPNLPTMIYVELAMVA